MIKIKQNKKHKYWTIVDAPEYKTVMVGPMIIPNAPDLTKWLRRP